MPCLSSVLVFLSPALQYMTFVLEPAGTLAGAPPVCQGQSKEKGRVSLEAIAVFFQSGFVEIEISLREGYEISVSTLSFLCRVRMPMRLLKSLRRRQRNPFNVSQRLS